MQSSMDTSLLRVGMMQSFFRSRLGLDLKSEIEFALQQRTGKPYWYLTPEQIKRYNSISIDQAVEEQLHRKSIADEKL
jgi:hypothetical protein